MKEIFERTSVRKFTQQKVEEEKIIKLCAAAMAAPTAANQREFEFVVVEDKENIEKLSKASPYATPSKNAPLVIVVAANKEKFKHGDYFQQDLAAATENLLLEAVSLNLGAVWMGIAPIEERMDKVSKILSLPQFIKPFALVAVGYPEGEVKPKQSFDESLIHREKY